EVCEEIKDEVKKYYEKLQKN
ncbi:nicotinate-nicotinamide nucleotide adenylyltransferase, partial [Campylobacter jejuni]|nr:nicotinate-nicotinamide nucleotide adenylyltransferase [Campylobacter jejuni]EGA9338097.1 nicotinate-nicotinamide nucleotide adenylyltransferase [Campylobacter jejuni]MBC8760713.1 nicotinate-nicotinamide nucleotide adenylyltransferase [Campylobacter jejuni]